MSWYFTLTKSGIVLFVLITGFIASLMSLPVGAKIDYPYVLLFLIGLYFLSSGSFILNQAQEWKIDKKMKRTLKRPIVSQEISVKKAYILSIMFIFLGSLFLYFVSFLSFLIGLLSVIFYNFFYTLWWKKKTPFAAVLGALPGAAPSLLGYSLHSNQLLSHESIYLFLILFLWQMPHFWALALKYKKDYEQGGIPVLPLKQGDEKTYYYMGLYLFSLILVALSYPLFLASHLFYFLSVLLSIKCIWDFFKFLKDSKQWISFFISINLSLLVFFITPFLDKMLFYKWHPF